MMKAVLIDAPELLPQPEQKAPVDSNKQKITAQAAILPKKQ